MSKPNGSNNGQRRRKKTFMPLGKSGVWLDTNSLAKPEEEPSLADQFIAATYDFQKRFHGRAGKLAADALLRYRIDMKHAHRFVLTDQFTAMATRLSFVAPEKTLSRIQYATLPYDQTWIEFSLHIKMKIIHELYGRASPDLSDVGERLGLLVQRIDDTSAVCTLVNEYKDIILPNSTSYFFSTVPTEFGEKLHYGCKPIVMPPDLPHLNTTMTREQAMDMTRASLWGYTRGTKDRIVDLDMGKLSIPKFLERHGAVGTSRMNLAYMFELKGSKLAEMMTTEIKEFTGTVRWLVTVLAMLNEVPVSTERIERSGSLRAGLTQRHNLLDYHKVTLKLPKTDPIRYFNRKLSNIEIARRRAHEVRSHWRTYLNEKRCGYEEHDWTYDEEHGYRLCGKCEAYSTLIPQHIRGDIKLGWITKNYVLTTKGDKHGDQPEAP